MLLICLWFLNANKSHSFGGHSSYFIRYPLNHKLHLLYQWNITLSPGTLVSLICHGTQQLFPLAWEADIRVTAAPEDCVVSGNGLGKACPDDPGYALWPFLQKKRLQALPEVLLNSPERKLLSDPKTQCHNIREYVSALFLLRNNTNPPSPNFPFWLFKDCNSIEH